MGLHNTKVNTPMNYFPPYLIIAFNVFSLNKILDYELQGLLKQTLIIIAKYNCTVSKCITH